MRIEIITWTKHRLAISKIISPLEEKSYKISHGITQSTSFPAFSQVVMVAMVMMGHGMGVAHIMVQIWLFGLAKFPRLSFASLSVVNKYNIHIIIPTDKQSNYRDNQRRKQHDLKQLSFDKTWARVFPPSGVLKSSISSTNLLFSFAGKQDGPCWR